MAAAALAAPQFQRTVVSPQKQFVYQRPVAPQYQIQRVAAPVYQQQRDPQYNSQRVSGAPTIVNFGLERTHPDQGELIIRQTQTHDSDGTYSTDVELEKGIKLSEQGYLKNPGTDQEAQVAQGQFSYVGDDGQTYTVNYIADENGFQPQGAHLPTPPPIPEALQRAYDLARADPDYKETDEQ